MNIFNRAPLAPPSAIQHGVNIIRKVIAQADWSNGLKTAEIYQLALQHPVPEGYIGLARFDAENTNPGVPLPPHNEHPVRSVAFLKQHILPVLQGSQEMQKVMVKREITEPIFAKGKRGKITKNPTKPTAGASLANPITIKAWVWKPMTPSPVEEPKAAQEPFGAAVGVGQDFSHLSKRRQAAREEKIQRDLKKMRRLQAKRERKRSQ